jgi:spermidine/putrescine transport system permease protein
MTSGKEPKLTASRSRILTSNVLLIPALLLLVVVIVVPMVDLLIESFRPQLGSGSFTWSNYSEVFQSGLYQQVLWKTVYTCFAATFITLIIAAPAGWAITRIDPKRRPLVMSLLVVPYLTSFLLLVYSLLVLLAEHGPLMDLLSGLHLAKSSSSILYTPWATLVMLVYESLPIAILVMFPVFERIDPSLLLAARGLGARSWQVLIKVILPLSRNGFAAASALVFIPLMGVFAEPQILGGPNGLLFGNIINNEVETAFDNQLGAAMSVILILYVFVIIALIFAMVVLWQRFVTDRLPREVTYLLRESRDGHVLEVQSASS